MAATEAQINLAEITAAIEEAEGVLGRTLTVNERTDVMEQLASEAVANASTNQPRHPKRGHYQTNGSGTGHGEAHDAAKEGYSTVEEDDDENDEGVQNAWSEAARKHSASASKLSEGGKDVHAGYTVPACKTTDSKDYKTDRDHVDASEEHKEAAKAHKIQGSNMRDEGNHAAADIHDKAAAEHEKAADAHFKQAQAGGKFKPLNNDQTTNCGGPTMNGDPHDHTKGALMASLDHDSCKEPALAAHEASLAGDSPTASKFHVKAAKAHEKLATAARKDDDDQLAAEHDSASASHRRAASEHAAAVVNSNPEGHNQYQGGGSANGPGSGPAYAKMASQNAFKESEHANKWQTATAHRAAAVQHEKAAAAHEKQGSKEKATNHKNLANLHRESAAELTTNSDQTSNNHEGDRTVSTRKRAIRVLTANCRCEADKAALNNLSDTALITLANATLVTNGDDPFKAGDGMGGGDTPFNPGAMGDRSGKKPTANAEDDNEDEDDEDEDDMPFKKKKPVKNASFKDLLAAADPETRESIEQGQLALRRNKARVVNALVGNILDVNTRKAMYEKLMKESMPKLKELTLLQGPQTQPTRNDNTEDDALYIGSGAAPTFNELGDDSDEHGILPLPVQNYAN